MSLTFGRYIAKNSLVHKMDPRIKMLIIILLITIIFLPEGFTGYALTGAAVFSLFLLSRLRLRMLLSLLKPIIFMVAVLFLVNCFLLKSPSQLHLGHYWGGGHSKHGGVSWFVVSERAAYQSIYLGIRIYLIIMITTILTSTTKPLDLTIALEDLMWPLKLIKFPVHIIATIIAIALRMIPTLIEEANRIMKAQASRGIDFRNGKVKEKIQSAVSLIIPLLVSSFQKAEDLAYAMDARGYNPHSKRTRFRKHPFRYQDLILALIATSWCVMIILWIYLQFLPPVLTIGYLDKFII